ncbi:MAG: LssY C-terminal domain-containing protein [Acidobacteriaceae bacterium]|nr:LssY C-terminal domain-containing protein [Acidobacteriaceae bacterium]
MRFRLWILASTLLLFAGPVSAAMVPFGTELDVRLTSEASSDKPSGQPVTGVVIAPVFVNGTPVIAAGTKVAGNTANAAPAVAATADTAEQPATLRIQFTKLEDGHGHSQALYCVLESVDNARESVDDSGLITGINQSQTIQARMDQGITKLASQYQGLSQILSAVKSAIVKPVEPAVDFKPGVEMKLKVTKAFDWSSPAGVPNVAAITPAEAVVQLVSRQPVQTVAENPPSPSDITNLIFIGSMEQLKAAFQEAGWSTSTERNRASEMETAKALIESRGYAEAPMSILYLDGAPPSLTFQKQNNTFEKRHHIRIWLRPQTFQGQPVWVGAATHDISIAFSKESGSFTHGIDPEIDKERAKVVNDMLFTGHVRGLALVDRTGLPSNPSNATGDKLITDGKIAVIEF